MLPGTWDPTRETTATATRLEHPVLEASGRSRHPCSIASMQGRPETEVKSLGVLSFWDGPKNAGSNSVTWSCCLRTSNLPLLQAASIMRIEIHPEQGKYCYSSSPWLSSTASRAVVAINGKTAFEIYNCHYPKIHRHIKPAQTAGG